MRTDERIDELADELAAAKRLIADKDLQIESQAKLIHGYIDMKLDYDEKLAAAEHRLKNIQAENKLLKHRVVEMAASQPLTELYLVFDTMPGPDGCRFIEAEDASGKSVNAGRWRIRFDGLAELVIRELPRAGVEGGAGKGGG